MSSVVLGPHLNVTCCIVINNKFMSSPKYRYRSMWLCSDVYLNRLEPDELWAVLLISLLNVISLAAIYIQLY